MYWSMHRVPSPATWDEGKFRDLTHHSWAGLSRQMVPHQRLMEKWSAPIFSWRWHFDSDTFFLNLFWTYLGWKHLWKVLAGALLAGLGFGHSWNWQPLFGWLRLRDARYGLMRWTWSALGRWKTWYPFCSWPWVIRDFLRLGFTFLCIYFLNCLSFYRFKQTKILF